MNKELLELCLGSANNITTGLINDLENNKPYLTNEYAMQRLNEIKALLERGLQNINISN